jgi:hypothetical protein
VKEERRVKVGGCSIEEFQKWEKRWYKCIQSKGEYFKGN